MNSAQNREPTPQDKVMSEIVLLMYNEGDVENGTGTPGKESLCTHGYESGLYPYLLTIKLTCRHCGAFMVGESGTGCSNKKYHYSVSKEELDKIIDEQDSELSEEELGKVAGGTSCALAVLTFSCLGVAAASIILNRYE